METYPPGSRPGQARPTKVASSGTTTGHPMSAPRRGKALALAVISLVIILVAAGAGWWFMKSDGEDALVNKGQYQTVFLSNGQVYFGKLEVINKNYLKLKDIYYLQVQQSVQPTDGKATTSQDTDASNAQTQLVKLGNELHGPEDSMQINRSQVLFWENIKADGKVAQAIAKDKAPK